MNEEIQQGVWARFMGKKVVSELKPAADYYLAENYHQQASPHTLQSIRAAKAGGSDLTRAPCIAVPGEGRAHGIQAVSRQGLHR